MLAVASFLNRHFLLNLKYFHSNPHSLSKMIFTFITINLSYARSLWCYLRLLLSILLFPACSQCTGAKTLSPHPTQNLFISIPPYTFLLKPDLTIVITCLYVCHSQSLFPPPKLSRVWAAWKTLTNVYWKHYWKGCII